MAILGTLWPRPVGSVTRQSKCKSRSRTRVALNPNFPAMGLDNVPSNSQPEPCTSVPRLTMGGTLVKLVENPFSFLSRNPDPSVSDPDHDPLPFPGGLSLQRRRDPDRTANGGEFHRIAHKVVKHLLNASRIEPQQG